MMRTWHFLVVAGLACGGALAHGQGESAKQQAGTEGKPEPKSAGEQLRTLQKEVDDAYAAYNNGAGRLPPSWVEKRWQTYLQKAEGNSLKMLEIVRQSPRSPESFAALDWIVTNPSNLALPYGQQAVSLLLEYHAENPKLGAATNVIGRYGRSWDEPVIEFLRAVSQRNPDRTVRGQAYLGLGRVIWGKALYVDYRKTADPAPLLAEAGRLFETVVEKYADCRDLRPPGGGRAPKTLGESARDELFELRELAVGKIPPEIAGEDIDGQPLKLSELRGKVVVLNFWASWCGPCMAMVPGEVSLVERMKGRPFALVGVNGDAEKPKAKKAVELNRMTWRSFWNGGSNGPITDKWNVRSWPTIYILDDQGVIRFKNLRDKKLDEAVELLVKELEAKQKTHGS